MEENQQPCDILRQMPTLSHMELCPTASRLLKVAQALQFLENEVVDIFKIEDEMLTRTEQVRINSAIDMEWNTAFEPLRKKVIDNLIIEIQEEVETTVLLNRVQS